jgi:hypothetical protein
MPLKRLWIVALSALVGSLAACNGTPALPVDPQIEVDPGGLYYGTDTYSGTCDTVIAPDSIQITNGGQNPLIVTSVAFSGPGKAAFTGPLGPSVIRADGGSAVGTPVTILSEGTPTAAFIQLTFAPPSEAGPICYQATLTITSNAANAPSLAVVVQGAGIPTPSEACPDADGGTGGISGLEGDGGLVCPLPADAG